VIQHEQQLSSDSFTRFGSDKDKEELDKLARQACDTLATTTIPNFAKKLSTLIAYQLEKLVVDLELHRHGVRHEYFLCQK